MAKVIIQIEDTVSGKVKIQVKPNFEELKRLLNEANYSPAAYYASRALMTMQETHQKSMQLNEELSGSGLKI